MRAARQSPASRHLRRPTPAAPGWPRSTAGRRRGARAGPRGRLGPLAVRGRPGPAGARGRPRPASTRRWAYGAGAAGAIDPLRATRRRCAATRAPASRCAPASPPPASPTGRARPRRRGRRARVDGRAASGRRHRPRPARRRPRPRPAACDGPRRAPARLRGPGFAVARGGNLILLARATRRRPRPAVGRLRGAGPGATVHVDFLTAGQDWAVDVPRRGARALARRPVFVGGEVGPLPRTSRAAPTSRPGRRRSARRPRARAG